MLVPCYVAATMKALVADDDSTVRRFIELVLRDLGFEVTVAADGGDAQTHLFAQQPDLLIVELGLPALGGQLLIQMLKTVRRDCKVIATSGMVESAKVAAGEAGADMFLA